MTRHEMNCFLYICQTRLELTNVDRGGGDGQAEVRPSKQQKTGIIQ